MVSLIFIIVSIVLLTSFWALTWYEAGRGVRLFGPLRSRLDQDVERIVFIWKHVDLSAFVREEFQHLLRRAGHDFVHFSLMSVRNLERLLTRLMRYFRMRQATEESPRESAREFVKTLSDFKDGLNSVHPAIVDVE